MKKLLLITLFISEFAGAAQPPTTLVCRHDDGTYWGTLRIDMTAKTVIDANELFKVVVDNLNPGTYNPEIHFQKYSITYVSEQIIRATESRVPPRVIEVNRHTLRLRYLKTGPPEWEFDCAKAERAF